MIPYRQLSLSQLAHAVSCAEDDLAAELGRRLDAAGRDSEVNAHYLEHVQQMLDSAEDEVQTLRKHNSELSGLIGRMLLLVEECGQSDTVNEVHALLKHAEDEGIWLKKK